MDLSVLYSFNDMCHADSVEWCPHEPCQNMFVCANYYLNSEKEGSQERLGKILLFSINPNLGLVLLQTIDTEGVLDQKWCQNQINGCPILGVVTAKSCINIYKLDTDTSCLVLLTSYKLEDDNASNLILSLDWSTGKYADEEPEIICSDSNGSIHLLKLSNNSIKPISSTKIHGFEAWIAGFYYWDNNVYFSGGDDCLFAKYDKRMGGDPIAKNRSHEAGVTTMHSNKDSEYLMATGSYDTYLRLWDIRYMKQSQNSLEMPGTLWRVKWNPKDSESCLVACMLGGVHIVQNNKDSLSITYSLNEHKNIAYGIDWCYLDDDKTKKYNDTAKQIISSCSFYDHLLCVSIIK